MIERVIKQNLLKTINHFPVTGIIGPRQVGKTTLAREISKNINRETVYIDLENPRDLIRLSDPNLFFEENSNKCVVLDEIQLIPELFSVLRPMVDANRISARYLILGPASPVLIRQSSQTLAGRIAYITLSGLNLTEVGNEKMRKLWLQGGFPDAFLADDLEIWTQWLDNFIRTYIERDLPLLGLKVSPKILRNLWLLVAHSHGSVINYNNFSKSLEISATTIKKYLDFLEGAFLIRQLQPHHINIKKRLVKSPKIYIRDTGILHNLLYIDSFNILEGHPVKGNSFEGFAIEQILQLAEPEYQPRFYRSHQGAECDLVLTKASKAVFAIEIKYSAAPKPTKGNLISFEDINAEMNFIITPNSDDFLIAKNIRVCSIYDFITKYL
jgi:predicted AAA+ superfamily ATPase